MGKLGGLTERYVKALAQLDLKGQTLNQLQQQLSAFTEAYESSPDLRNVLVNPAFTLQERKAIVTSVLAKQGASSLARAVLLLLCDKNRIRMIPDITVALEQYTDAQAGIVRAYVRSATPMSPTQVTRLTQALTKLKGGPVKVSTKVDSVLIGGVVVEVEGVIYDGSVRRRLVDIRERLLEEAE
jgi:F-type H+-transporting ATPase subunit delta